MWPPTFRFLLYDFDFWHTYSATDYGLNAFDVRIYKLICDLACTVCVPMRIWIPHPKCSCQNMCKYSAFVGSKMSNCISLFILMLTLTYDNSYNYLLLVWVGFFFRQWWEIWYCSLGRCRRRQRHTKKTRDSARQCTLLCCICSQLTSNLSFSYFIQSRLNRLLILIFSIDVDLFSPCCHFSSVSPIVYADLFHGGAQQCDTFVLLYSLWAGCPFVVYFLALLFCSLFLFWLASYCLVSCAIFHSRFFMLLT